MYSMGSDAFAAGFNDKPKFSLDKNGSPILTSAPVALDGQTLVWTEAEPTGRAYLYDVRGGAKPTPIALPARAIAPAVPLAGGVLAPLANGSLVLVPAEQGQPQVAPFMPPLVPGALPRWTRPVALADQKTFLVSDGRDVVYAVAKNDRPQPQLTAVGESRLSGPVVSPLVLAGSTIVGVIRQERSDAVAGFDARGGAAFEPVTLEGRVEAGPFAVGGLAFVAAEPDGLVCFGSDGKVRWQQPLDHGPLAGPLLACADGDLLTIHQSGEVCRVDAASGKELARHSVGEPLSGPASLFGEHVLLAGSDGVVHRISIPRRP